ncbi:hydratase [Thalassotalea agariperforans]
MSTSPAAEAATELLNRRQNDQQLGRLNESYRPTNLDEAFAIHDELIKQSEDTVGGWKCLLPLAEDKWIAAPIFANTIRRDKKCEIVPDKGLARIEPEIAFVLAKDLPARKEGYTAEQIDAAVGNCHMALELMKSRFAESAEADFYEKLADCLVNQGMFIGPIIDKKLAYNSNKINIKVTQNGETTDYAGVHPNELPYQPVHWFIDTMSKRGISFTKGQAIITGSFAGIVEVDLNAECEIEYEGIDKYKITFIPA